MRVYVCTCVDLVRVGTCMQSELNLRPPGEAHAAEVLSSQVKKSIGIIKQDQLLGLPWHPHALPYAFQGCGLATSRDLPTASTMGLRMGTQPS